MAPIPPLRVLVVDDEVAVSEALKMMLEFDGHQVKTCADGGTALHLLGESEFDLLITDYSMPAMKGDRLAAEVKSATPELPIIMVTAYAEMLKSSGIQLTGVDYVISKPFLMEHLRGAISTVLH